MLHNFEFLLKYDLTFPHNKRRSKVIIFFSLSLGGGGAKPSDIP